MAKVIAYLNGGLGNQMFQYASARALAQKHNAELVLDNWSGFVRDYQYRRHYELNALPIKARIARPWERIPLWLYRWQHRQGKQPAALIESRWYGRFITEPQFAYLPKVYQVRLDHSTWLVGYWQSPHYFQGYAEQLRSELMPQPPTQQKFLALGAQLRQTESVALGVRLYEESKDPAAHAAGGKVKSVGDIRDAVERMKSKQPNARFFIFCTHRSPLLDQLGLPAGAVSVTHDDGYEGTLERLWLLSQCRHHIMTNSSYYWWGAWLSATVRGHEGQRILAADNFINRDGLCSEWEKF